MKVSRLLLGTLLAGMVFVGCAKDEVKPADPVTPPAPPPSEPSNPPAPEVVKEKVVTVHFKFDSSRLNADQKKIIKDVLSQRKDGTKVVIVGYTDSQGSKKYNQKLSEKRSEAVSHFLKSINIESDASGKGEEHLLNSDKTKAEHKLNRRADIAFIVVVN